MPAGKNRRAILGSRFANRTYELPWAASLTSLAAKLQPRILDNRLHFFAPLGGTQGDLRYRRSRVTQDCAILDPAY